MNKLCGCLGGHSRVVAEDKVRERSVIFEHCAVKEKPDEGSCGCFSPWRWRGGSNITKYLPSKKNNRVNTNYKILKVI